MDDLFTVVFCFKIGGCFLLLWKKAFLKQWLFKKVYLWFNHLLEGALSCPCLMWGLFCYSLPCRAIIELFS